MKNILPSHNSASTHPSFTEAFAQFFVVSGLVCLYNSPIFFG